MKFAFFFWIPDNYVSELFSIGGTTVLFYCPLSEEQLRLKAIL